MAIDTKLILGIIFIVVVIVAVIIYFLFRKPKSPIQKEIEYELDKLKKAQENVKQYLGLVSPIVLPTAKCRPTTDQGFITAINLFDTTFDEFEQTFDQKKDLIPDALKKDCEDAMKNAVAFGIYLGKLEPCQGFCEYKGTAKLVSPRECQCIPGFTNPQEVDGFIQCSPTKATEQVQKSLTEYQASEKGLSDFFTGFSMNSLPSKGCIDWAGGYDTPEKRKKANDES